MKIKKEKPIDDSSLADKFDDDLFAGEFEEMMVVLENNTSQLKKTKQKKEYALSLEDIFKTDVFF